MLAVESFGIGYNNKEESEYLIKIIKENHEEVSEVWNLNLLYVITLKCNYKDIVVDIIMYGYIGKVLH